ncbi:MAG: Mrp/NBP35 family ATP-binding protein [Candidatus Hermodarchaeota archaeon]
MSTQSDQKTSGIEKNVKIIERFKKIKHSIVIMSGKGGVGKSTVAANLALALSERVGSGLVGVIDADIHGPNIPKILGAEGQKPQVVAENQALPVSVGTSRIKLVSMSFFLQSSDTPVIWRGPLKMSAIRQFLSDFEWGELEYLIIDLPPGTGDEPLSILQLIPEIAGVIIVTTPQEVALLDCQKSLSMVLQMNKPVLGVVENMSEFICPSCGQSHKIFGEGGGQKLAKKFNVDFLGSIPIDLKLREQEDTGLEHAFEPFREIAKNIHEKLNKK